MWNYQPVEIYWKIFPSSCLLSAAYMPGSVLLINYLIYSSQQSHEVKKLTKSKSLLKYLNQGLSFKTPEFSKAYTMPPSIYIHCIHIFISSNPWKSIMHIINLIVTILWGEKDTQIMYTLILRHIPTLEKLYVKKKNP